MGTIISSDMARGYFMGTNITCLLVIVPLFLLNGQDDGIRDSPLEIFWPLVVVWIASSFIVFILSMWKSG